jgi:YfiH family protein
MEDRLGSVVTPAVDEAFRWADGPAGRILRARALEPLAAHAFTTRALSFRGETADADYARLAAVMGVSRSAVATVSQVHGREVAVVSAGRPHASDAGADAIVSTDAARAIAVRIADCVPILVADAGRRAVAAIHAGWKGTAAAVASMAVRRMEDLGATPETLVAAIGPSIGPCCYQVDARVRDTFLAATPDSAEWFTEDGPGHWRLDLWQANADLLAAAGVPAHAIHVARLCTAHNPDVSFSYRREGPKTGRLVAAIRLTSVPSVPSVASVLPKS